MPFGGKCAELGVRVSGALSWQAMQTATFWKLLSDPFPVRREAGTSELPGSFLIPGASVLDQGLANHGPQAGQSGSPPVGPQAKSSCTCLMAESKGE